MVDYDPILVMKELSEWVDSEEGIRALKEVEEFHDGLAIDLARGREYQPWMEYWHATI